MVYAMLLYTTMALIRCVCVCVCVCVSIVECFMCFRVIDLGVMAPCDKILKEAIKQKAGALYSLDRILSIWDADRTCFKEFN